MRHRLFPDRRSLTAIRGIYLLKTEAERPKLGCVRDNTPDCSIPSATKVGLM
jgi:hypothetical protein